MTRAIAIAIILLPLAALAASMWEYEELWMQAATAGGATAWTPIAIPGCVVWIDSIDSVMQYDGTLVTNITDLSGNANHLRKDAVMTPPVMNAYTVGLHGVISFTNTGATAYTGLRFTNPIKAGTSTWFVVYKKKAKTSAVLPVGFSVAVTLGPWPIVYNVNDIIYTSFGADYRYSAASETNLQGYILAYATNTADAVLRHNGIVIATPSSVSFASTNQYVELFGGRQGVNSFECGIDALAGYSRVLTADEITALETWGAGRLTK